MVGRLLRALCVLLVLAGCAPATAPVSPARVETARPAPSSAASPASAIPPASLPSPTPAAAPAGLPEATLPVRGLSPWEASRIRLAPAGDGSTYVLIPDRGGSVLAHLAADGSLAPGWPVHLPFAPDCQYLGVAADGSVRLVCEASDIAQPEWCCDTVRAFAVRPDGLPIAGWPIEADIPAAVRVVGDALVLVEDLPVTDMEAVGSVRSKAQLTTIAADGTIETGAREPIFYRGGNEVWAIGADGLAYVTSRLSRVGSTEPADWTRSELRKLGPDGFIGGWMVVIEGIASEADVGPDGLAVLEVGVMDAAGTRVRSVDHLGGVVAESDALPYQSASSGLQCTDGPVAPLRANEGVVTLGAADTFFALDANLDLLPGWPYGPEAIQSTGWPEPGELDCGDPPARPVLAPDGTLYVPLAAPSDSTGGGLVAIARDGSTVAGWPVGLRRADSGFWTLALRANAGLFALAVEREAAGVSATLLAIDPDSTVRWRTTIVDP